MNRLQSRWVAALALLGAAALVSACGGDSHRNVNGPGNGNAASEVPQSAQDTIEGLNAFLKDLIANRTDETSEPIVLGNATLPTSETSEPLP